MYKEYPKFLAHEIMEYGRKSRTDDPLLTWEEVLERHSKILEEYAINNFGAPVPEENKFTGSDTVTTSGSNIQSFNNKDSTSYSDEINKTGSKECRRGTEGSLMTVVASSESKSVETSSVISSSPICRFPIKRIAITNSI